jgi:arabinogalactan oligomer/maltooligosaccharide transport system substrate-binding protein
MKRIFTIVLAATLLLFAFAACSESSPSPAGPGSNGGGGDLSTDPVTLTVWESTQGPDEFIRQAGEAFTAKHPNITIQFVNVELGDSTNQIMLDGPAGVGPDVFAAPHDRLGDLVVGGLVMPVTNASAVRNQTLGACSLAATFDGVMYGYPVAAETYGLFYNKDLIDTAPTTWEEVVAFSREFNAPNRWGFAMDVTSSYYTILFTTNDGNRLFGPSGTDTSNTNINSPASVEGMTFFQSLREILDMNAEDLSTAIGDASFTSGAVAMYITGPWNISPFSEVPGLNFGVAPLPALPGQSTPAGSFSGTRCMFVSAFSDHPAEAHAFAEFLTSDEMQMLRFDLTGAIPSVDIPIDSEYLPGLIKQLDYAFPMPSIPQMGKYWDAMGAASVNIWNGGNVQAELDAANAAILAD